MKIKINITPSTNKHWIGAEVSMENSTEMQTDEHNIHGCDQLSHLLRKMLGFTDDSYQGLWFFCPSQSDVLAITSLKVINFQHPYSPVTHSIPQCYTSLIPLHNPPPPQHLHTSHSIPHFTTLTANRGSPNFHSTTCGSHLTCGLLGSPGKQLIYVTLLIDIIYSYMCTFNYNTGKCL